MNQQMLYEKVQAMPPTPKQPRGPHMIGFLASLLCFVGAVYVLWNTGNVWLFLLLIGVADGQVPLWRAIRRFGLFNGPAKPDDEGTSREEEV